MKKQCGAVVVLMLLALFGVLRADNHYTLGIEGIKAATVPPPGYYARVYNYYYSADTLTNSSGGELDVDFDLNVAAVVPRFYWVKEVDFFGADYVCDLIVPFVYADFEMGAMGIKDHDFGLGDICLEPIGFAWHFDQLDVVTVAGAIFPTGSYDKNNPASVGQDHWTGLFTLGATYYFDTEKTWHASALSRYEIHSENDHTDVRRGNDYLIEWGLGKTINKTIDVGVSGYCQWQITDDSGDDVTWDKSVHDRVYAVGPELSMFVPEIEWFVSFRYLWEFEAKDRPEGSAMVLTLTKRF